MNREAVSAIGEVTGAILVLNTLVYLSIQIRQNTIQQKRDELVSTLHGQNAIVGATRGKIVEPGQDFRPLQHAFELAVLLVINAVEHKSRLGQINSNTNNL